MKEKRKRKRRAYRVPLDVRAEMVRRYVDGETLREIGDDLGWHYRTVHHACELADVERRTSPLRARLIAAAAGDLPEQDPVSSPEVRRSGETG